MKPGQALGMFLSFWITLFILACIIGVVAQWIIVDWWVWVISFFVLWQTLCLAVFGSKEGYEKEEPIIVSHHPRYDGMEQVRKLQAIRDTAYNERVKEMGQAQSKIVELEKQRIEEEEENKRLDVFKRYFDGKEKS